MDYDTILRTGLRAAYEAGGILSSHFGNLKNISKKGVIDLVTEADIASEKMITGIIRKAFPDHEILAEEGGRLRGETNACWIIDPLDGTVNFSHNLPIYCISIAFSVDNEVKIGIVFNPSDGELFTAIEGKGALLNNKPIAVSATQKINDSLLATGFPYDVRDRLSAVTKRLKSCLDAAQGVRRLGSAALDLCYVACGRFDGFWEENLRPWDMAAGALIVQQAGGRVTDYADTPFGIYQKQTLASNGHIHSQVLELMQIEES